MYFPDVLLIEPMVPTNVTLINSSNAYSTKNTHPSLSIAPALP